MTRYRYPLVEDPSLLLCRMMF